MAEPQAVTIVEAPPDDISADIAAALTSHETPVVDPGKTNGADTAAKPDAAKVDAKAATSAVDEGADKPAPKAGERQRGPNGRFIKADGNEASAEEEAAADKAAASPEKTAPAETGKPEGGAPDSAKPDGDKLAPEISAMLARLPAADKAKVLALPGEAQQILASVVKAQTADYTKKTQAIAAFKADYEPIEQMFAPHRELMKQKGLTPASTIQAWYNVEKRLMEGDGVNVIKGLIAGYRIDPRALAQALNLAAPAANSQGNGNGQILDGDGKPIPGIEQSGQVALPPQLAAALETLARRQDEIDQRVRRDDDSRALEQRRAKEAAEHQATTELENFKSADDGKGNLLHPHFDEVEQAMTRLAFGYVHQGQKVPPLQELYEDAVWANPSTRAQVIAAEKQADEKRKTDEARAKAARASKAGSSTTGAPGSGQAALKPVDRTLSQELEAAFEAHAT